MIRRLIFIISVEYQILFNAFGISIVSNYLFLFCLSISVVVARFFFFLFVLLLGVGINDVIPIVPCCSSFHSSFSLGLSFIRRIISCTFQFSKNNILWYII